MDQRSERQSLRVAVVGHGAAVSAAAIGVMHPRAASPDLDQQSAVMATPARSSNFGYLVGVTRRQICIVALGAVLLLEILQGILLAALASVLLLLAQTSRPPAPTCAHLK
jgi:hypothetical protein